MSSTIVRSIRELRSGDHIAWPTDKAPGLLEHHAIVVAANGNYVKVIHVVGLENSGSSCSGNVLDSSLFGSGNRRYSVREELINLKVLKENMKNGQLRRYDYAPGECNDSVQVIELARSKLGEFDFRCVSNNCEHFVRRCKTGNAVSCQVASALSWITIGVPLFGLASLVLLLAVVH